MMVTVVMMQVVLSAASPNPLHDLLLLGIQHNREGCKHPPAYQSAHEQLQRPAAGHGTVG
jgi:hypothetical protein